MTISKEKLEIIARMDILSGQLADVVGDLLDCYNDAERMEIRIDDFQPESTEDAFAASLDEWHAALGHWHYEWKEKHAAAAFEKTADSEISLMEILSNVKFRGLTPKEKEDHGISGEGQYGEYKGYYILIDRGDNSTRIDLINDCIGDCRKWVFPTAGERNYG